MGMKLYAGKQFKAMSEDGVGLAVFATLNVVDKDGDVTLPGAFGEQSAIVLPAHDWRHVPIGKARIREEGNEAIAEFRLNMEIASARDWQSALKFDIAQDEPGIEWSYGFDVLDSGQGEMDGRRIRLLKKLKVHEVSPVIVGAGEGTRTLLMKSHPGMMLVEQIKLAIAEAEAVTRRAEEVKALRDGKGKSLGIESAEGLAALDVAILKLYETAGAIRKVLSKGELDDTDARKALVEFELTSFRAKRIIAGGRNP